MCERERCPFVSRHHHEANGRLWRGLRLTLVVVLDWISTGPQADQAGNARPQQEEMNYSSLQ